VIDALGLADGASPDLLAVSAVPGDLGDRIQVVLSGRPPAPGLARVPHLGEGDAERLRALAGSAA